MIVLTDGRGDEHRRGHWRSPAPHAGHRADLHVRHRPGRRATTSCAASRARAAARPSSSHPGERVEPKVVAAVRADRCLPRSPTSESTGAGTTVLQSPSHAGRRCSPGGRLVAYGRTSQLARTRRLRLSGQVIVRAGLSFEVPLDPEQAAAGRTDGDAGRARTDPGAARRVAGAPQPHARRDRRGRRRRRLAEIVALARALRARVARDVVRRRGKARSAGRWFPATPTRARGADDRLGWIVAGLCHLSWRAASSRGSVRQIPRASCR